TMKDTTQSLHDALPILLRAHRRGGHMRAERPLSRRPSARRGERIHRASESPAEHVDRRRLSEHVPAGMGTRRARRLALRSRRNHRAARARRERVLAGRAADGARILSRGRRQARARRTRRAGVHGHEILTDRVGATLPRAAMNVLFLLPALVRGGSETKTVTLANLGAAKREPPAIAYLLERPAPLRAEIDPRVPMLCLRRKGKFSLGALLRLRSLIERERVPLVLCMNLYPVLYASAVRLMLGRNAFKLIVAVNITEFARIRDRLFMALYRSLLRLADAIVFGCELQRELWQRRYRLAAVPAWVIYNGVDV